jgi:hypothetical protein
MNGSRIVTQRSRKSRAGWLLAAFALAATGCVDFDKETMVFVFPPDSKEVRGLLIYEGLSVQGNDPDDLENAKKQLTQFVADEKEFCLGDNFQLHFNQADEDNDDLSKKLQKQMQRKHLVIHNGAFFLNPDGKLCGYQTVTVKDRESFVRDLNAFASAGFSALATEWLADDSKRAPSFDEETLRRLQKAAGAQFVWFQLEPGRVSFTAPATSATIQRVKADLLGAESVAQLRTRLAEPDKDANADPAKPTKAEAARRTLDFLEARGRLLSEAPWSFDQRADRLSIALGVGGGAPIRLAAYTSSPGGHREELLAHARTLKAPFKKDLTAEKLAAEFVKGKGTLPAP